MKNLKNDKKNLGKKQKGTTATMGDQRKTLKVKIFRQVGKEKLIVISKKNA